VLIDGGPQLFEGWRESVLVHLSTL
jgi:hypothetical protein